MCSTLWPPLGWQTIHHLVRELHSEEEVRFCGVIALPKSVGIEDADVDQPPYETRPALATLPPWQVRVVKLIDDIDSAGMMEVVTDGLWAAELIDLASIAPALQRCR